MQPKINSMLIRKKLYKTNTINGTGDKKPIAISKITKFTNNAKKLYLKPNPAVDNIPVNTKSRPMKYGENVEGSLIIVRKVQKGPTHRINRHELKSMNPLNRGLYVTAKNNADSDIKMNRVRRTILAFSPNTWRSNRPKPPPKITTNPHVIRQNQSVRSKIWSL